MKQKREQGEKMLKYLNTALSAAALSLTLGGVPQAAFAQDSAEPIVIPTHNWSSQVVMAYVIGGIFESIGDKVDRHSPSGMLADVKIA